MNIFLMLLAVLFMAGYYIISSPSQRVIEHETQYAVQKADLKSIAECTASAQNAALRGETYSHTCVEKYDIFSQYVCLNSNFNIVECETETTKNKPVFNFIITSSYSLPTEQYNSVLEILEKNYPDVGTFGIFKDGTVISGNSINGRSIQKNIIKTANLQDGQLVYITQYSIPDQQIDYATEEESELECPVGTVKTYRFGRWQCIAYNYKGACTGDTIWDADLLDCVADETRKPLCATKQSAILVDNVWECVDPFSETTCPDNMIHRLNYETMEWECIDDPNIEKVVKKCDKTNSSNRLPHKRLGAILRIATNSCTDCEKSVTDEETCETHCVPDPDKLSDPKCYAGNLRECTGSSRAFYFGFTSTYDISKISALSEYPVSIDNRHSQNRMFNCLDCGDGYIDTENSLPPYTAVCR